MIELGNVSKNFGRLTALNDVSIRLGEGRTYALIGPNGSGKTTLIKCILGMVLPDKGTITVEGSPIAPNGHYRSRIGYMPQIGRYPDNMKIGQILSMIRDLRPGSAVDEELVEAFQLPAMSDKRMRTLSGGTRQKVSAALAFLFSPPIMILDEPTAGLDPLSSEILKDKIRKEAARGRLVLITSHIMSDLEELTTELIYLQDGVVRYDNDIVSLKASTGERTLGRAIALFMKKTAA
jgi:Cu-processing system ATP-binding protein